MGLGHDNPSLIWNSKRFSGHVILISMSLYGLGDFLLTFAFRKKAWFNRIWWQNFQNIVSMNCFGCVFIWFIYMYMCYMHICYFFRCSLKLSSDGFIELLGDLGKGNWQEEPGVSIRSRNLIPSFFVIRSIIVTPELMAPFPYVDIRTFIFSRFIHFIHIIAYWNKPHSHKIDKI